MRQISVFSLLAVSISLASSAYAEQLKLEDSTIVGKQQGDATAPTIAEKRAEFARIPGGASVVDAETYKTGRSSSPQDALGQATGVYIQSRSGAEESRLSIRGSGLQRTFHQRGILLMQDGAPLNLADGSGDFQSIEPIALDHIEVMRGANAWRYGAANLGGAINFVTPTGKTAPKVQLRAEAGSFDYQRIFGAVAEDFGDWDAYLSFSDYSQDGFRDHARQENQRYFANIGGRINERLSTRFYISHVETDSEIPGSLTKAQLRRNPEQAALSTVTGDNKRDFTLNRIGNITTLQLDGGHSLELSSFYSEKSLWHPIFQVLEVDSEDVGVRLTHKWQNTDGWRWSGGVEALQGRNQAENYVNVAGKRGNLVDRQVQTARSLNAFTELEVPLAEDWALIGGLTWLHSERDIDDKLKSSFNFVGLPTGFRDDSFTKSYSARIGRIGLRHDLADGVQLFTNLSQSYEPPTFSELTGGAIVTENEAQKATTLEAGMRFTQGNLDLDLAVYRSEICDELLGYVNPLAPTQVITTNADRTVHQGIEFGGAWQLGEVVLRGQYLLNDFRFDNDPAYGNNRIAGVPSQFLKGEALWQRDGWYAGPTVEWVPVHYAADHAETLYAEAYAIWGLKGGYRPREGLGFFVEGRNLSDKTYISTTGVVANARGQDAALFMPGDGRSLYVGLEWKL
ncbi:TonB-dependent receptor [Pseudomonas sp. 32.2.56]|uniref:TonB-dependent receptor family protein n=1 Tax=Pseudomonas sp. 32.2.56 TaxID=2969303 RepID=UPI00214F6BEA|nr:TonB-dependent receptor [Pseudomonas sp. 32.2.56]MCR4509236.1 TonB-dependent receptor [Pseudomonas sp. 32.2.56]